MSKDQLLKKKDALLYANQMALIEVKTIKENLFADDLFYEQHVRNYILYKFHLHAPQYEEDSLKLLAQESVARIMKIDGQSLDFVTKCDGMTSSGTKISLLFFAIQKDFGFTFPVNRIAEIDNVGELAADIRNNLSVQEVG